MRNPSIYLEHDHTFDLIRADSFVWFFALFLSTSISLPLPPLATLLDTLDSPLNPTGLTNCIERGARRTWSWFHYIACIGNMARLGKVALGLQFALTSLDNIFV